MLLLPGKNSKRQYLFILTGVFAILLGLIAITGWYLNIGNLVSVFPQYATMKMNTALCMILSGIAFILLIKYDNIFLKRLFILITIVMGGFALLSLSQDVFNWNAGIDQLFVKDLRSIAQKLPYPGRMSPSTSLCFSLIAISFVCVDSPNLFFKKAGQYLLHMVTLITFIAIIGYLFKVPYSAKFIFFSSMAVNTAFGFLVLSTSASAINYNLGLTRLFTGNGIGNYLARRLFPRMLVILIAVGYVSLYLLRNGYITPEFSSILSTITFLLIGLFLIKDSITEMNRLDMQRTAAENETQRLNRNLEDLVLQRTIDLKHSNDRFQAIFNVSPICIALTNIETGHYVDVNPAIVELLGYSRDEIIGHTAAELDIISAEYRRQLVDSLRKNGLIRQEDIILKDKYNNLKHCLLTGEMLEDHEGKYMMTFVYDITDRKIAQDHLQDAKDKLQILTDKLTNQNKQLLSFAHIISHNLRSPVSNLNLLVHFYKESTSQEDKDDLWGNFETVIQHLNSTLDELLETLKIQEDTAKEREELSFDKTFNSVKSILIGQIKESQAIIKTDFSQAPSVSYPKIYLESIMMNMLSNAIKYKSPKRKPEISLVSENIDGEIILRVKDNGLGIDLKRHAKSLFGLRKTFHRHSEAKGLGLFITKTQIDAMGGEISAESAVDVGTTFKIVFNKK